MQIYFCLIHIHDRLIAGFECWYKMTNGIDICTIQFHVIVDSLNIDILVLHKNEVLQ